MSADRDDDALSWAGDNDPTLASESTGRPERAETPDADETRSANEPVAPGWRIVGKPGRTSSASAESDDRTDGTAQTDVAERGQMGSVALIAHGIVGGIFLLYAIGWLVAIGRDVFVPDDLVGQFMYSLGHWLAVLAPALWFGATLWATRRDPSVKRRMLVFVIGVIVLAPWPFIVGVNQ